MPAKKFGMIDMLKGMLRIKKPPGDDIVYQAERIIAEYVSDKRGEILSRYSKKTRWINKALTVVLSCMCLFLLYRIIR